MSHHTSPASLRGPAAFLAGAALLGTCALTTIPAQAATIGGADSAWNTYFAPAKARVTVSLQYLNERTGKLTHTFPAGIYWVKEHKYTNNLPFYVEGLSEKYETETIKWSQILLEANGPLSIDTTTGAANTGSSISVWSIPADAPELQYMTNDEVADYLTDESGKPIDPIDEALITAASIPAAASDPFFEIGDAPQLVEGDFLGIGTAVGATRIGTKITIYEPGSKTRSFHFGRPNDTLLVGDWNGDGQDTFGIRRGNLLFLDDDLDGGWAEHTYTFGRAGDEVLVGDWDGDGKDTVAVRRGNTFYVTNNFEGGNAPISYVYGRASDYAVAGDWNVDGKDTISIQRGETLFVKNTLTGGAADGTYAIPFW